MQNSTKELMHIAMGNKAIELLPIMHQLSRYRDVDRILKWLIQNRITGNNLHEYVRDTFKNSVMSMVKFIVKYSNKNRELAPVIIGKDWA